MISKTILAEVRGFTPLVDVLVDKLGVMDAVIFGRVWRYCQMETGKCTASMETIAAQLALSQSTVRRHLQRLCNEGYLKDETPDRRNAPHIYSDTGKVQLIALIEAGLSERPTEVCQKDQPRSVRKTNEDSSLRDNQKKEKEEEISFNDFEGHPDSIKNKPEVSSRKGHRPSVADPSKDPPELEELARQLATPIDLVWGYDKATDKSLLHAARELFRQCKQGSIDDILDALDAYLDPAKSNAQWVRENIDSPMGLVTLVARQYQKRQAQAQRRATSSTEWQEASDRTQKALAERDLAPARDPWWDQVLADLSLTMPKAMFDTYIKDTTLLARDGSAITVGVKSQHVLEWIENRLAPMIDRSLTGYGVERIQFEVVGISSRDVRPLMGNEE